MSDPALVGSSLLPSLSYGDAPAAIEWLNRAFGFTRRLVVPRPEGGVLPSELSLGPGVTIVGSARPEEGRLSPKGLAGVHQGLCVLVDDPDGHRARARAAGATLVREPRDEEYGARGYQAGDPEGHSWHFGADRPGKRWGASAG